MEIQNIETNIETNIDNIETEITEPKPKFYNENMKKAIYKHREKNRAAYNERQRLLYIKLSQDPEWKARYNERSRETNRKYREKMRGDEPPKSRGRPRKIKIETEINI